LTVFLVVRVEGDELAVLQDHKGGELPRTGAVGFLAFLHCDAQFGATHQLAGLAILVELDQPRRVAEVRLARRGRRCLVGVLQIALPVK
jgi:hypothetical protein